MPRGKGQPIPSCPSEKGELDDVNEQKGGGDSIGEVAGTRIAMGAKGGLSIIPLQTHRVGESEKPNPRQNLPEKISCRKKKGECGRGWWKKKIGMKGKRGGITRGDGQRLQRKAISNGDP